MQVDDSQKRFNSETNNIKNTAVPSRYTPFVKGDEVNSQTSSVQSSNEKMQTTSSVTPVSRVAPQPKAMSHVNSTQQVRCI